MWKRRIWEIHGNVKKSGEMQGNIKSTRKIPGSIRKAIRSITADGLKTEFLRHRLIYGPDMAAGRRSCDGTTKVHAKAHCQTRAGVCEARKVRAMAKKFRSAQRTTTYNVQFCIARNSAKVPFYLARAFFTSSVSLGTILKRSPTMPTSATLKIGAVLSLLMAMM